MMKNVLVLLMCLCMAVAVIFFSGCAGTQKNQEIAVFAVETIGMSIGYEMRDTFVWSDEVQKYYDAIMNGELNLLAAQAAEAYLKKRTNPILANRIIRLAEMSGFDLENGQIVGVGTVDIAQLQAAFTGFKLGLELQ